MKRKNKSIYYSIEDVLYNIIFGECTDRYTFIKDRPVERRRKKYKRYRNLHQRDMLKCKCCGRKAYRFKFVRCIHDGKIHKPTGLNKYTFILVDRYNSPMTFDHWIPMDFLKKRNLIKYEKNIVLMCRKCNGIKGDLVPFNWKELYKKWNKETKNAMENRRTRKLVRH